jgi:hypothetical protein
MEMKVTFNSIPEILEWIGAELVTEDELLSWCSDGWSLSFSIFSQKNRK